MEGHRDSKNALESTSECKHARLVHIEQGRQTRSPTASLSLTGCISTSNFARSHGINFLGFQAVSIIHKPTTAVVEVVA